MTVKVACELVAVSSSRDRACIYFTFSIEEGVILYVFGRLVLSTNDVKTLKVKTHLIIYYFLLFTNVNIGFLWENIIVRMFGIYYLFVCLACYNYVRILKDISRTFWMHLVINIRNL